MLLRVNISQADINGAIRCSSNYCAAGIGLRRILISRQVAINKDIIYIDKFGIICETPKELQYYLSAFDRGLPIPPFSFSISVPRWMVKPEYLKDYHGFPQKAA